LVRCIVCVMCVVCVMCEMHGLRLYML
jgi:hypothetical protein